jgi:TonB family protein
MNHFKTMRASFILLLALPAAVHAQPGRPPSRAIDIGTGLDSAAAVQALRQLPAAAATPGRQWVFTLRFAPGGTVDSVGFREAGGAPRAALDSVAAVLRASARRLPPSDSVSHLYLVAVPGPAGTLRPVREEEPRLLNQRDVAREVERSSRGLARAEPERYRGRSVQVTVRVRVLPNGAPDQVTVMEAGADPAIAEQAVRAGTLMRFAPARIEDEPVAVWVALPIAFVF